MSIEKTKTVNAHYENVIIWSTNYWRNEKYAKKCHVILSYV